jgi:hypothetical protein
MNAVAERRVRISSTQRKPDESSISLTGLTPQEAERTEGMIHGQWWVRGKDGRLEFHPTRESPPDPTEDDMLPEWRNPRQGADIPELQMELLDSEREWDSQSSSIIIQHLCGYNYSPEGYKRNAEGLERCGFFCMRSRRGDDGRFWEVWFLPGLWAAKGPLNEAIRRVLKDKQMEAALKFIPTYVSFGTLDIAVQRMCQVLD